MTDRIGQELMLLEALYELRDIVDSGAKLTSGVCHNVDLLVMEMGVDFMVESHLHFHKYVSTWGHFSGNESFPVPIWFDHDNNWSGKARELRSDLIDHLIICLEEEYDICTHI